MLISLNLPDYYIDFLNRKRAQLGIKSRQAAIRLALEQWAEIPMEFHDADPLIDYSTWPIEQKLMVCPGCLPAPGSKQTTGTRHCGGGEQLLSREHARKVSISWVCVCRYCSERHAMQPETSLA